MAARSLHQHNGPLAELPEYVRFPSRRSVVWSRKGMVSTSQPIAVEAGLEILRRGGNAADAAVAVSAALNVVEPTMCGVGGDAFCLFYDAKTKEVKGLNGSGRAPSALTLEKLREKGVKGVTIPILDLNSVTVPGAAAAWVDTVALYGSGKLTLAEVLAPAIQIAEEGVPISELSSTIWQTSYKFLATNSPSGHEMLITDPKTGETHSPRPGEVFRNPTLAQTFRSIAEHGKAGFYEGRIAEAIAELVQAKGGEMTVEDIKAHETTVVTPITKSYGGAEGYTLHECPPNGQGLVALLALGILEALEDAGVVDMSKIEHNSVEWLHTLIEVTRLAFADGRAYISDPAMSDVPVEQLLSKEYLATRAKLFDPKASKVDVKSGSPFASSDTVLMTTADSEGNACSFIQSNYAGFGTCAIPKGCGFTLQNRGTSFHLEEGHPNNVAGGKRPYHTIIPAIVTRGDNVKGGDLFMAYGVMGGFMQPQGHLQVLANIVLKGMNPQQALDAPRFCISAALPDVSATAEEAGKAGSIDSEVFLEEGISEATRDALLAMGHDVHLVYGADRGCFGRGQVIQRFPDGVWAGGSDMRADGHAAPQII